MGGGLTAFHAERDREIRSEWLVLAGRFALHPGPSTVGAGEGQQVQLPSVHADAEVGTLDVGETLTWTPRNGAPLAINDDSHGPATIFEHRSLRLHVIKRGDERFLRVKDLEHPALATFKGLEWFPAAPRWRLTAHFEPAAQGTTIDITNVLNKTSAQPSPGALRFELDGQTHRLIALTDDEPGFFVIFKDATSGHGTYPAGRFLHVGPPKADGSVELDFNRAYSPPCAFTKFATCPLPPRGNTLPLAVEAGERGDAHVD